MPRKIYAIIVAMIIMVLGKSPRWLISGFDISGDPSHRIKLTLKVSSGLGILDKLRKCWSRYDYSITIGLKDTLEEKRNVYEQILSNTIRSEEYLVLEANSLSILKYDESDVVEVSNTYQVDKRAPASSRV